MKPVGCECRPCSNKAGSKYIWWLSGWEGDGALWPTASGRKWWWGRVALVGSQERKGCSDLWVFTCGEVSQAEHCWGREDCFLTEWVSVAWPCPPPSPLHSFPGSSVFLQTKPKATEEVSRYVMSREETGAGKHLLLWKMLPRVMTSIPSWSQLIVDFGDWMTCYLYQALLED